jgi:hypothetical protein
MAGIWSMAAGGCCYLLGGSSAKETVVPIIMD